MIHVSYRYWCFVIVSLTGLAGVCSPVLAHTPQDAIDVLHISPDYDNDSTVFVVVQNYLLRSTNRGASWKQLVSGLDSQHVFSDISVSPGFSENGMLFVSTDGGGVYRSIDRGQTWHRFNHELSQLNVGMILVSADSTGTRVLAAGSARGLYVSPTTEAGWRRAMSDDVQITALRSVRSGSSNYVLAGDSTGGIWKSEGDLRVWRRVARLKHAGAVTALAVQVSANADDTVFVGTQKSGLLKSTDDGLPYQQLSRTWPDRTEDCLARRLDEPVPDNHVRDIELIDSPDGPPDIFVTTWNRAVHVSHDAGASWKILDRGITCDNQADSYAIGVPHYRDLEAGGSSRIDMFVAGFDGLYRSEDGGKSWIQFETLPVSLIRGIGISGAFDGQYGLAITTYGGGAYITSNQGESWSIVNQGLQTTRLADVEFAPGYPTDRRIFGLSKEMLLAGAGVENGWKPQSLVYRGWRRRIGAGLERRLGFSAEYGTKLFLSDAERTRVWPMQIELSPAFAEDGTMLVGLRRHGVWKSEDAGESWDRDWDGPTDYITALQISPDFADDGTAFAGVRGSGIYVSRDGADSWQASNSGFEYLEDVRATSSPNYYIDPPLYTAIKDVLVVVSSNYAKDQMVFASSASGLFRSRDGGHAWSELIVAPELNDVPVNALGISPAFAADQTVVVSFKGRGLFISTDGGTTFESIGQDLLDQNYDLKLIVFSPEYERDRILYGATDEALLRSQDNGVTWAAIDRPVRYENWRGEDRGPIRFDGDWRREVSAEFSASTQAVSDQPGAQATLNFHGSTIAWVAERGPGGGQARVRVDGIEVANVDLYSQQKTIGAEVFRLSGLDVGPHDVLVEVSGEKNASSIGRRVTVDAFDVLSP